MRCEVLWSACLCVCLSAYLKNHTSKFHQILLHLLPVSVNRAFSDGNAIRYVLPVLRMTSCFHIMQEIGQNRKQHVCFVQFAKWRHQGRSLPSPNVSCLSFSNNTIQYNCACRTLQFCYINKHWSSWLVSACLCDKVAVCDMHSCVL